MWPLLVCASPSRLCVAVGRLPVCLTTDRPRRPLALWLISQTAHSQPASQLARGQSLTASSQSAGWLSHLAGCFRLLNSLSQNRKSGYVVSRMELSPAISRGGSEFLSANVAVLEPGTCRPPAPPAWGNSARGRFCAVLTPVGWLRESVSATP